MLRFDVLIFSHCCRCSRILGRMFRTKLDLKLKSRGASGSPFFHLRESIVNIIYEHAKEPEVGMQKTHFLTLISNAYI